MEALLRGELSQNEYYTLLKKHKRITR
jgi:hypothetical protein